MTPSPRKRSQSSAERVRSFTSAIKANRKAKTPLAIYIHAFSMVYIGTVAPWVIINLIKIATGAKNKKILMKRILRQMVNGLDLRGLPSSLAFLAGGTKFLQSPIRPLVARVYASIHGRNRKGGISMTERDDYTIDLWSTYTAAFICGFCSICLLQSSPDYAPKKTKFSVGPGQVPRNMPIINHNPSKQGIVATSTSDMFEGLPGNVPNQAPVVESLSTIDDTLKPRYVYSPTLELTLFFVSRACDSVAAYFSRYVFPPSEEIDKLNPHSSDANERRKYMKLKVINFLRKYGSTAVFQLACWRIMFAFFYAPWTLPPAYNRWISKMAHIHPTIPAILRFVRQGDFVYGNGATDAFRKFAHSNVQGTSYSDLAYDPFYCNNHVPCGVIHGNFVNSTSCTVNVLYRFYRAIWDALPMYVPIHVIPTLLRGRKNLKDKEKRNRMLKRITTGIVRSVLFLSTFVASCWAGVCIVRTVIPYRLLGNRFYQQHFDAGLGPFFGSFLCGFSLLLESPSRRREMGLYVVPRAYISVLSDLAPTYLSGPLLGPLRIWFERLAFALSTAYISTCMFYKPKLISGFLSSLLHLCYGDLTSANLRVETKARRASEPPRATQPIARRDDHGDLATSRTLASPKKSPRLQRNEHLTLEELKVSFEIVDDKEQL